MIAISSITTIRLNRYSMVLVYRLNNLISVVWIQNVFPGRRVSGIRVVGGLRRGS